MKKFNVCEASVEIRVEYVSMTKLNNKGCLKIILGNNNTSNVMKLTINMNLIP